MIEAPWRYVWEHAAQAEWVAARPLLLGLWLLLPLLWRHGRRHDQPRSWRAARCIAAAALIAAAAGVAVEVGLPDESLHVVVAQDVSASIEAPGRIWQEEAIDELRHALSPLDRLSVIHFAADAVIRRLPSSPSEPSPAIEAESMPVAATHLEAGVDAVLDLLVTAEAAHVVVLTDGNQTVGEARRAARRARALRRPLHFALPPVIDGADASVERLVVPPLIGAGAVFPLHLSVRREGAATSAEVELSVDDRRIGHETVNLHPGRNGIEIPYQLEEVGPHRLEARVRVADDVRSTNDAAVVSLTVVGRPRVLLVTPRPRSPLRRVLEAKGIAVESVAPAALGRRDFSAVHALVLEDPRGGDLDTTVQRRIEAWVRDAGGGLVFAGGEASYGDPALARTPLAQLLPVTLETRRPPRAERQPLSLVLLIDRSNSMAYHVTRRTERSATDSKLVYAQRAARAVLEQLRAEDRLGIIAFDSASHVLASLQTIGERREALERAIARLEPAGGTDFFDGLKIASEQLAQAPTGARHVMLLTDGDSNRPAEAHAALLEALAAQGITVTAIRIGDDDANLALLQDIAQRTGGAFHHVENALALPELMLRDATSAMARLAQGGPLYVPTVRGDGQAVRGLGRDPVAPVYGYAYAETRPGADVLMAIASEGRQDPLLAVWQYGSGRVAALTASPRDDAELWVAWRDFGKLWSQLVRWVARPQIRGEHVLTVERAADGIVLHVGTASDADEVRRVRLEPAPGQVVVAPAVRAAARRFRAVLADVPPGIYPVTLTLASDDGVEERVELVRIPDVSEAGDEMRRVGADRAFLTSLAAQTGGSVGDQLPPLPERRLGERRARRALDLVWILLAIVALLYEVAARRRVAAPEVW